MSPRSEFRLDLRRRARIGLDEAVFCAGKSPAQIAVILARLHRAKASCLLTRLDPERLAALPESWHSLLDYDAGSHTAIFGKPYRRSGRTSVAVVSAGTSDQRVAREVARTMQFYGAGITEIADVGVAGLWRLVDTLDLIRRHRVVIVVAGMDAALQSVIGGLAPGAIIAVPTSVGYGVAEGGTTALHAALASCAPGVTVVNIDNGYGAACAALRILNARRST